MADTKQAENVQDVHSEDEWETVVAESGSPITFENVGDQFIGQYRGIRHITPPNSTSPDDEFDQGEFVDTEGNLRVINLGYKLSEALNEVSPGSKVRITRTPDVEMSDAGKNNMKDYRVDVAR